jgi:hypothetical protein
MTALFLAAQLVALPVCTTVQPSPAFVCVNGGWLPPGHPGIPAAPPVDVPPPNQPTPAVPFRIGRRYTRNASGTPTTVFIMAAGQLPDGVTVLVAQCEGQGDGCFYPGMLRLFLSNTSAADWTEVP